MSNFVNIPLGYKIPSQIPLDIKGYSASELQLKDLGLNNNLAFTYHQGLVIYCIQEKTRWEWKEALVPGGLLTTNFTYPANTIAFGINYSGKQYNFYPIDTIAPGLQDVINVSGYAEVDGGNSYVNFLEMAAGARVSGFGVNDGAGRSSAIEINRATFSLDARSPFNYAQVAAQDGVLNIIQQDVITGFTTSFQVTNPLSNCAISLPAPTVSGNYTIALVEDLQYSPLELINEGSGSGIIVRGRNAANYGNIGIGAIDLSVNNSTSLTHGATGSYSFVTGRSNTGSGHSSTSMGTDNTSSGQYSFSIGAFNNSTADGAITMGYSNTASQWGAVALGKNNYASGEGSVVLGYNTVARSLGEVSVGTWGTDYTAIGVIGWDSADRAFNVGIGSSGLLKKDGLTVFKSGLATLPTVTTAMIAAGSVKSIVTKEYLDSVTPNGSETKISNGTTTAVTGNGTVASPYIIENVNPQKRITTSYTLTSLDNNYTIFVNNGVSNITITVPTGLADNLNIGFIQEGTGTVTFVASGSTIYTPIGLKIKGQYYNAYIEKDGATNNYYLLGNLIV